jgi:hypothetical protein
MSEINWGILNPNTPRDIVQTFIDAPERAAKMRDTQISNQLQEMALQNAQRDRADDQATRAAWANSGGDINKLAELLGQGGQYKQAMAMRAQQLDQEAKRATINKDNAQTGKYTQETALGADKWKQNGWASLAMNPTREHAATVMQEGVRMGFIQPDEAQRQLAMLPDDPAQIKQIADRANAQLMSPEHRATLSNPKPMEVRLGNVVKVRDMNPNSPTYMQDIATDQVGVSPDAALTDNRARSEGAMNRGLTMRGQNMTDARAREWLVQGKVPAGYRANPDGTMTAIQGGPADLKLQGAFNQDTAALNGSMNSMDRLAVAANEVMKHPGLPGTSGLRGALPNIPGSDAANAAALINTLKSQVAFGVLQDMRNNSKTGGALGNVSDKEGQLLQSNIAALEKSQSVESMRANLQKIIDYSAGAKDRLRQAYNLKHGGQPYGNNPSQPVPAKQNTGSWKDL